MMQAVLPLHDASPGPWDARLQRSRSIEDVPDGLAGVQKLATQVTRDASSICTDLRYLLASHAVTHASCTKGHPTMCRAAGKVWPSEQDLSALLPGLET